MFGKKKKPKKLDAQVIPIEERIAHLENIAAHNEESKIALLDAIEKELDKISEVGDESSRCRERKQ